MKYVIVVNEYGSEVAILFDETLDHSAIAGNRVVKGAGFCEIYKNTDYDGTITSVEVSISGESKSLGVSCRNFDQAIVEQTLSIIE